MLTIQYYLQKTIRFIRNAFLSRTFNFITKQIQFTYMLPYFLSSMYCNDACRLGALKRPSANTLRRHVHYPNACLYSTFVCILMTHSFRPYVLHSNTHTHTHAHAHTNTQIYTQLFKQVHFCDSRPQLDGTAVTEIVAAVFFHFLRLVLPIFVHILSRLCTSI